MDPKSASRQSSIERMKATMLTISHSEKHRANLGYTSALPPNRVSPGVSLHEGQNKAC